MKFADVKNEYNKGYKALAIKNKDTVANLIKQLASQVEDLEGVAKDEIIKRVYDVVKGYDEEPKCIICRTNPRLFDAKIPRYLRLCGSKDCNEKARAIAVKNGSDGSLLNDAQHQVKMLQANGNAKTYEFSDGAKYIVRSGVEVAVLKELDRLGYKSSNIKAPADFAILYKLPGEDRERNHLPDVFESTLNIIISAKDGLDNPNMHPNFQKDRLKSLVQYLHIAKDTKYNFVQIEGYEDIKNLEGHLKACKDMVDKGGRYLIPPRIDFSLYHESPSNLVESKCISVVSYVNSDGIVLLDTIQCPSMPGMFYLITDTYQAYKNNILNKYPDLHAVIYETTITESVFYTEIISSNPVFRNNLANILFIVTGYVDDIRELYIEDETAMLEFLAPFTQNVHYKKNLTINKSTTGMDFSEAELENFVVKVPVIYNRNELDGTVDSIKIVFQSSMKPTISLTLHTVDNSMTIMYEPKVIETDKYIVATNNISQAVWVALNYIMDNNSGLGDSKHVTDDIMIMSSIRYNTVSIDSKYIMQMIYNAIFARIVEDNSINTYRDIMKELNIDIYKLSTTKDLDILSGIDYGQAELFNGIGLSLSVKVSTADIQAKELLAALPDIRLNDNDLTLGAVVKTIVTDTK